MEHVSDVLNELRATLYAVCDDEVSMAFEVGAQYITDHNDASAYRDLDRQVNALARSWYRMIAALDKWEAQARKIEASCENFYGD